MTYFADLTPYIYDEDCIRPHALNVGWLDGTNEFKRGTPTRELLNALWAYCEVSVCLSRGVFFCELCSKQDVVVAARRDRTLLLGAAEIRVFSDDGKIFAAPNLLYHYVEQHNYAPPAEFVKSAMAGVKPPSARYFELLSKHGIEWSKTKVGV